MKPPSGANAELLEKIRSIIKKPPPNIGIWSYQETVRFKDSLKQVRDGATFAKLMETWRFIAEVYGVPVYYGMTPE